MFEVEVHSSLRDFLREHGDRNFPHHLTMARLIARALRIGRPTLMQTGSSVSKYCLSYLMPILLGDWSVIIVAPPLTQKYLLQTEIPLLQDWLGTNKSVRSGDRWQLGDGLLLTTPQNWLRDRLGSQTQFPGQIPTLIERADNLEEWTRDLLTTSITAADWEAFGQQIPQDRDLIRNTHAKLAKSIFARPQNPYGNHVLLKSESTLIQELCQKLATQKLLPPKFAAYHQQIAQESTIFWISRPSAIAKPRETSSPKAPPKWFTVNFAPGEIRTQLKPIWHQQPIAIVGSFLDIDANANTYRQRLGLDLDMLSLKFTPNRQNDRLQLYLPNRLPLPNTPQFQPAIIKQSLLLVSLSRNWQQPIVVIVDDVPLQGQVGSALAAEFGSRVRVESTTLETDGILICSWNFWQQYQEILPTPRLAIVATLPIPSIENPLVANRVAYYKNRRQDWFRLYLLPTALKTLEQAIVPWRESQSIVALLDNRVNSRSYGQAILAILEPYARISYIDPTWFGYPNS